MLKRTWQLVAAATVVVLAFGVLAQAETITIDNAGFEAPPTADYASGAPTSWTSRDASFNGGRFNGTGPTFGPLVGGVPEGTQAVWANNSALYQVLSTTLQANTTYTLSVSVGSRNDGSSYHGATIALGYGDTFGANLLPKATTSEVAPALESWSTWTDTFVTDANPAGSGQFLRVELITPSAQTLYDNVQLTATTTPEPSTLILLSTGLTSLLCYAWRKRQMDL